MNRKILNVYTCGIFCHNISLRQQQFQCETEGKLKFTLQLTTDRIVQILTKDKVVFTALVKVSVVNGDNTRKITTKTIRFKEFMLGKEKDNLTIVDQFPCIYSNLCILKCTMIVLEYLVRTPENVSSIVKNLPLLFLSDKFSDARIQVEESSFPVHLAILTSSSPVFTAMFEHYTAERKSGVCVIEDFGADVIKEMLYYLYKGDLREDLPWEVVTGVHVAAEKYAIVELKKLCDQRLMDLTTLDSIVDCLVFADSNSEKLKTFCFAYIYFNQVDLLKSDTFKSDLKKRPDLFMQVFEYLNKD